MFKAIGMEVVYLKRVSMGSLKLDENLELGEYRKLTDEEVKMLQKQTRKI
jgi:16S rRNA pseudouridine516 synthase